VFGLDERILGLSNGGSALVVLLVAVLLGLRHAMDPDHIAAVTTLVASNRERAARRAAQLGVFWGLGHALTLIVFGLPIVLFERFLPETLQRGAETMVAGVIVFLATRLLIRWRSGYFHAHAHAHPEHEHEHRHPVRTPFGAFGIGLVHGLGGSAGVAVLLLAAMPSRALAVASLVVLAVFTAVSMTMVTGGYGRMLAEPRVQGAFVVVAPSLGVASLLFGLWYAAATWSLAPYPF
jgi:high-affinity nickel permease